MADGTALACRYARTMEIWSLRNLYTGSKYTSRAVLGEDRDFGDILEGALNSLECLESLSWSAGWGDVTNIEKGVLRGVRSIVSSHQDFTATVAAFRDDAAVLDQLRDICPTSFISVTEWGMNVSYDWLKYYCLKDTRLLSFDLSGNHGLASLLEGRTTTPEDTAYWLSAANFKSIQALQIKWIQIDVSQTIFSQSTFWMALRDAGCRPLEFSVDFITDPMLDYLESFSNLQYLCVKDTRTHRGVHDSEELATKFYKNVLRAHKETLLALVVDITLPGPWLLQRSNMVDLSVCRKLGKLAIALPSPKDAISQELLERALNLPKSMPCLYQLSILEMDDDWIAPGISRFNSFITAFRGKQPLITALGKRRTKFRIPSKKGGGDEVRYQIC